MVHLMTIPNIKENVINRTDNRIYNWVDVAVGLFSNDDADNKGISTDSFCSLKWLAIEIFGVVFALVCVFAVAASVNVISLSVTPKFTASLYDTCVAWHKQIHVDIKNNTSPINDTI